MSDRALHILHSWFSPSYPVGSYSYSHGLEVAMADGRVTDGGTLHAWISELLRHGAGRVDAILLAAAYRAGPGEVESIAELAAALAPSAERLHETMAQGGAFSRVTGDVLGTDATPRPYPVAVGAAACAMNLPLTDVLRLYLHAFAANLISAAVRFMPLGQTEGQRVLASLFDTIDEVAVEALAADPDDMGGATLVGDLAAMRHETLEVRIFRT